MPTKLEQENYLRTELKMTRELNFRLRVAQRRKRTRARGLPHESLSSVKKRLRNLNLMRCL